MAKLEGCLKPRICNFRFSFSDRFIPYCKSPETGCHNGNPTVTSIDFPPAAPPTDAITSEFTRLRSLMRDMQADLSHVNARNHDLIGQNDGLRARVRELEAANHIDFYEREFYPLSNFSAFCLDWDGLPFATSEAAYHWEKFRGQPGIQLEILRARSAHDAFKLAERFRDRRRPDWDEIKVAVMLQILQAKATQHEYVRRKLLETGNRTLIECSWRDDFWGWGANKDGQNMLGKLWMQVRDEVREAARRALEATDAND